MVTPSPSHCSFALGGWRPLVRGTGFKTRLRPLEGALECDRRNRDLGERLFATFLWIVSSERGLRTDYFTRAFAGRRFKRLLWLPRFCDRGTRFRPRNLKFMLKTPHGHARGGPKLCGLRRGYYASQSLLLRLLPSVSDPSNSGTHVALHLVLAVALCQWPCGLVVSGGACWAASECALCIAAPTNVVHE